MEKHSQQCLYVNVNLYVFPHSQTQADVDLHVFKEFHGYSLFVASMAITIFTLSLVSQGAGAHRRTIRGAAVGRGGTLGQAARPQGIPMHVSPTCFWAVLFLSIFPVLVLLYFQYKAYTIRFFLSICLILYFQYKAYTRRTSQLFCNDMPKKPSTGAWFFHHPLLDHGEGSTKSRDQRNLLQEEACY